MKEVSKSKYEVAEANLLAALHLYFQGEDYVPVHTLAAAANEVIERLAERHGVSMHHLPASRIKAAGPKISRIVFEKLNFPQNFMKHADFKNDNNLVFNKAHTEFYLYEASRHLMIVAAHEAQNRVIVQNCILPFFYNIYFYVVLLHKEKTSDIVHGLNPLLQLFPVKVSPFPESQNRTDWGAWYADNGAIIYEYIKEFSASLQFREFLDKLSTDSKLQSLFDEVLQYKEDGNTPPRNIPTP